MTVYSKPEAMSSISARRFQSTILSIDAFKKCSGIVPAIEESSTTCDTPAALAAAICTRVPS